MRHKSARGWLVATLTIVFWDQVAEWWIDHWIAILDIEVTRRVERREGVGVLVEASH